VLGLISFGWQVHTYRDSFAERVLVRLSIESEIKGDQSAEDAMKQGDLVTEIVNTGQHPLYLNGVSLALVPERDFGPDDDPRAWEFSPDTKPNTPLEPGAATHYRLKDFDFSKHPLDSLDDPARNNEDYVVTVESNKGEIFRSRVGVTGYTFIGSVSRSKQKPKTK
jgi:hypothetical protein